MNSSSESDFDIGGCDKPMTNTHIQMITSYGEMDSNGIFSDESDFDATNNDVETIPDRGMLDELQEMESNNDEIEIEAEVLAVEPVEPNRGEKYVGQGKNNNTVWWSMPSQNQKLRTTIAARNRKNAVGFSKENFRDKKSAFYRIMPISIVEYIVMQTNRKAKRVLNENRRTMTHTNMRHWVDTNVDEIYAFIGIVLHAGAEKSNLVQAKDLFDKTNMAFYRAVMPLYRFEQLCRFMRFDNSAQRRDQLNQGRKFAAFDYVWRLFVSGMAGPFHPSKEFTIDEQLLPMRNRCSFRQYIPSKPGKYGIKIFWLVDSQTNYPLAAEVYLGAEAGATRSKGIAHDLVLRLMENYLNTGVNVTMDNFFTSTELAKDMLEKSSTIVGTIRSNKADLPKIFTSKDDARKRGAFSSVFCFSGPCQLVSYTTNSKKNVLLLSTAHCSEEIDPTTSKPKVIHDYNKHKGGVDTFDKMIRGFTCKRKTNRWPMAVFYNLVDVAALAAFRLFEFCHPAYNLNNPEKRKIFLKELSFELAEKHLSSRATSKNLTQNAKIAMELIGIKVDPIRPLPEVQVNHQKRRCETCKKNKKDNKTTAVCDICYKPTCTAHYIRQCADCYLNNCQQDDETDYNNADTPRSSTSDTPMGGSAHPSTTQNQRAKRTRRQSPT